MYGGNGTAPKKGKSSPGGPSKRDTDDSALHHVPTHLQFQTKSFRIYRGATAYVWVEIDGKNLYFDGWDYNIRIWIDGKEI